MNRYLTNLPDEHAPISMPPITFKFRYVAVLAVFALVIAYSFY